MTREELLEYIDEGIRTEESATALYLKHLDAIVSRSGRPADEIAQIKDIIVALVAANRRHKSLLDKTRQQIMTEDIHVY